MFLLTLEQTGGELNYAWLTVEGVPVVHESARCSDKIPARDRSRGSPYDTASYVSIEDSTLTGAFLGRGT